MEKDQLMPSVHIIEPQKLSSAGGRGFGAGTEISITRRRGIMKTPRGVHQNPWELWSIFFTILILTNFFD